MKSVSTLVLLGVVLLMIPRFAQGQKVYRIGAVVADDQFIPAINGFKQKMTELGYVEGKNIVYDFQNSQRRSGCPREIGRDFSSTKAGSHRNLLDNRQRSHSQANQGKQSSRGLS
ncbi:MAG TPA: hypothetical protein VGK77_17600 [Candidatus Binatia bacterium]